jgi:hypothetical protein
MSANDPKRTFAVSVRAVCWGSLANRGAFVNGTRIEQKASGLPPIRRFLTSFKLSTKVEGAE